MDQSSILSAMFDCPVARQNVSLLATEHDCETGLLANGRSGVSSGHFELSHLSINEVELGTEYHGLAAPIMSGPIQANTQAACVQLDDPMGVICHTVQKLIG